MFEPALSYLLGKGTKKYSIIAIDGFMDVCEMMENISFFLHLSLSTTPQILRILANDDDIGDCKNMGKVIVRGAPVSKGKTFDEWWYILVSKIYPIYIQYTQYIYSYN